MFGWRFDLISFVLGAVLAGAVAYGVVRYAYRLRELWAALLEQLKSLGELLTAGADNRYREALLQRLQHLHLAGALLDLDDVLVPPRFLLEEPLYQPDDDFEPSIDIAVPVAPDLPFLGAVYDTPARELRDLGHAEHPIALLGALGSGKSTALQALAIEALRGNDDAVPRKQLPIYVCAGDLDYDQAEDIPAVLAQAVSPNLPELTRGELVSLYTRLLDGGRALLLFDGLDELPVVAQNRAIDWLAKFRFRYPDVLVIAAALPRRYTPLMNVGLTPVFMGGWSVQTARNLVDRWVQAWPAVEKAQGRRRGKTAEIDPALVAGWLSGGAVGRKPLDMTLKIWTGLAGDAEGPHPINWWATFVRRLQPAGEFRAAMQQAALRMLSDDAVGITRATLRTLIDTAGRDASVSDFSGQDPQDLIDSQLRRPGGLLRQRAGDLLTPAHPLLTAYLAAHALAAQGDSAAETLSAHLPNPRWLPVFGYYVGMTEAALLVGAVLRSTPDTLQSPLFEIAGWVVDAPGNARWRGEILKRLATILLTPDAPVELRGRALAALVGTQDANLTRLLFNALESQDALGRQLAAIGLGALGDTRAVPRLTPLLHDDDLLVRWGAALALSLLGTNPGMDALATALMEADTRLSVGIGQALALNPAEGHPVLVETLEIDHPVVRRAGVAGFERVARTRPEVIETMRTVQIEDSDWMVRTAAGDLVTKFEERVANPPMPLPEPDEAGWLLAWAGKQNRAVPAGEAGMQVVYDALNADDVAVRTAAADYLGRRADDKALPLLQQVQASAPRRTDLAEISYRAMAGIDRANRFPIQ